MRILTSVTRGVLGIGACAVLGVGVAASIDTRSPSSKADAWVRANINNLPEDLDSLARLPVRHRVAVFQAQSPEVRSNLAREHFAGIRRDHSLTPEQDQLIDRLTALASPEAYGTLGQERAQAAIS